MIGKRVDVYRNLHKDCYSVKDMEPGSNDYGNVIAHVQKALIDDPEFVVQPGGLQRARESGVKNVHAFIRGTLEDVDDAAKMGANTTWAFSYRPLDEEFFDCDKPFLFGNHPRDIPIDEFETPKKVYLGETGQYGIYDVLPYIDR